MPYSGWSTSRPGVEDPAVEHEDISIPESYPSLREEIRAFTSHTAGRRPSPWFGLLAVLRSPHQSRSVFSHLLRVNASKCVSQAVRGERSLYVCPPCSIAHSTCTLL